MAISINGAVNRREFLFGSAAAMAAGRAWGQGLDPVKMKRIAIMTLSLRSVLKTANNPNGTDIMDFADLVADKLGIHNIEMYPTDLGPGLHDPAYIAEFLKRLKKANSQITQVIGNLGPLTATPAGPSGSPGLTMEDILKARHDVIDQAAMLGSPRVMILTGNALQPDTRPAGIAALKAMAAYGKPKKVRITMENFNISSKDGFGRAGAGRAGAPGAGGPGAPGGQAGAPAAGAPTAGAPAAGAPGAPGGQAGAAGGGRQGAGGVSYSAPWDVLLEVCKASGTYINPDTGNFFDNTERMKGLPLMYPHTAGGSHVKYNPTQYDTAECIKIAKRVGYKGLFTIEAQGGGGRGAAAGGAAPDPFAMPIIIRDIILANM
jgi:sugar phosphate isomerase/epimerase